MPSRDVNAATRLAEASWRRDKRVRHESEHRRKPRYLSPSSTPSIPWLPERV